MSILGRKKIVLLGMMTKIPVAGAVWGTMQYLIGFQRLGYDAYYVEAHARTRQTPEAAEGLASFAEKRAARWSRK